MVNSPQRSLPAGLKLALDFAPLAVFFIGYKLFGLMAATGLLVVATIASLAITYGVERKIAMAPLISGVLVAALGGLTILLDDERFIKIKPTLVNMGFALTLLIGVYGFRRGLLRHLLGMAFHLTDEGWMLLSRRWGFFFLFLAALNESIWRNFPTEFWVNFKVFGMFTLTVAFALSQSRMIEKYSAAGGK